MAAVTGTNDYTSESYFPVPNLAGDSMVSFDWDASGDLYYGIGDPNFATRWEIWRYSGGSGTMIYSDPDAFAGYRVSRIGDYIYFNDGGTLSRWTVNGFKYDPVGAGSVTPLWTESDFVDLWGMNTLDGTDFIAAGGWTSAIYYSQFDANGDLVLPLTMLGTIGESSGPVALDLDGNLYYCNGFVSAGDPVVYRWSAAEVASAITDPMLFPLDPVGHEWATVEGGFNGATGMVCDAGGNVILTATSYVMPSELRIYSAGAKAATGVTTIATSPGPMGTVRYVDDTIYVCDASGIYFLIPPAPDPDPPVPVHAWPLAVILGLLAFRKVQGRNRN